MEGAGGEITGRRRWGLEQLMWCDKKIKLGRSVGMSDNNIVLI